MATYKFTEEQAHVHTLRTLIGLVRNISTALKDLDDFNDQLSDITAGVTPDGDTFIVDHCDPDFVAWLTEAIDGDFPVCETAESLAVIFDKFQEQFEEYRIEYSEEARKAIRKEMKNG